MRAFTAFAGLPRSKLRLLHGFLSAMWILLALAGFVVIEVVKEQNNKQHLVSCVVMLLLLLLPSFFDRIRPIANRSAATT